MDLVPLEVLWCQCRGNASATPHQLLIHQQMTRMHAEARGHALCYVGVVLTLYVLGLAIIVRRSGRSERHSALSALSFCLSRAASSLLRRANGTSRRRQGRQQGQQKREAAPVASPGSSDPRQQQTAGAGAAGPSSLQLHLLAAAKEEAALAEPCLTTVA